MIEIKQIIGRGTRIAEDYDKTHFTIIDFRNATDKFADPEFAGDPVQIYEPKESDPVTHQKTSVMWVVETNLTKILANPTRSRKLDGRQLCRPPSSMTPPYYRLPSSTL